MLFPRTKKLVYNNSVPVMGATIVHCFLGKDINAAPYTCGFVVFTKLQ